MRPGAIVLPAPPLGGPDLEKSIAILGTPKAVADSSKHEVVIALKNMDCTNTTILFR